MKGDNRNVFILTQGAMGSKALIYAYIAAGYDADMERPRNPRHQHPPDSMEHEFFKSLRNRYAMEVRQWEKPVNGSDLNRVFKFLATKKRCVFKTSGGLVRLLPQKNVDLVGLYRNPEHWRRKDDAERTTHKDPEIWRRHWTLVLEHWNKSRFPLFNYSDPGFAQQVSDHLGIRPDDWFMPDRVKVRQKETDIPEFMYELYEQLEAARKEYWS